MAQVVLLGGLLMQSFLSFAVPSSPKAPRLVRSETGPPPLAHAGAKAVDSSNKMPDESPDDRDPVDDDKPSEPSEEVDNRDTDDDTDQSESPGGTSPSPSDSASSPEEQEEKEAEEEEHKDEQEDQGSASKSAPQQQVKENGPAPSRAQSQKMPGAPAPLMPPAPLHSGPSPSVASMKSAFQVGGDPPHAPSPPSKVEKATAAEGKHVRREQTQVKGAASHEKKSHQNGKRAKRKESHKTHQHSTPTSKSKLLYIDGSAKPHDAAESPQDKPQNGDEDADAAVEVKPDTHGKVGESTKKAPHTSGVQKKTQAAKGIKGHTDKKKATEAAEQEEKEASNNDGVEAASEKRQGEGAHGETARRPQDAKVLDWLSNRQGKKSSSPRVGLAEEA